MRKVDNRILEILVETEIKLSPRIIAVNTDYSRHYVSERLPLLLDADLVEKVDDGLYQITNRGRAYLSGDLNAAELEED